MRVQKLPSPLGHGDTRSYWSSTHLCMFLKDSKLVAVNSYFPGYPGNYRSCSVTCSSLWLQDYKTIVDPQKPFLEKNLPVVS